MTTNTRTNTILNFRTQSGSHYQLVHDVLTVERAEGHWLGEYERWYIDDVWLIPTENGTKVGFRIPLPHNQDMTLVTSTVESYHDLCGCMKLCLGGCFA